MTREFLRSHLKKGPLETVGSANQTVTAHSRETQQESVDINLMHESCGHVNARLLQEAADKLGLDS